MAASSTATSIGSGAPSAGPWISGAKSSTGTADEIALPSASTPVNQRITGSVIPSGYDYSLGYLHLSRVLTLYDAGLGQGSLYGRRLGFCLRGGSGLLSGQRGFFSSHCCGGFIFLPG
jgi:hypothetical protein